MAQEEHDVIDKELFCLALKGDNENIEYTFKAEKFMRIQFLNIIELSLIGDDILP